MKKIRGEFILKFLIVGDVCGRQVEKHLENMFQN